MWPIPVELTLLIASHLQLSDLLAFSCISRYYRKLLLPLLFSTARLQGSRKSKFRTKQGLKIFTSSEQDVKDTIRSLTAETAETDPKQANRCNKHALFQFLPTLNNLRSLSLDTEYTAHGTFKISDIPALMKATKHAPLQKLFLKIDVERKPSRVITPGPTGLDTLCIHWNTNVLSPKHKPGGAFDHLFALITPSLASLSHLELSFHNWDNPVSNIFNLTMLKPAAETLRNFHLDATEDAADGFKVADDPFRIVAETLPKLTKLSILDLNVVWNDDVVDSLALLSCLTHLALSPDLENPYDRLKCNHDMPWYRRCLYRRFHATEKIFAKCPQLEQCSWKQQPIDDSWNPMYHNFVVVDTTDQGRVLKPVMQWWMVDRYKKRHGGDLPDMVKGKVDWDMINTASLERNDTPSSYIVSDILEAFY